MVAAGVALNGGLLRLAGRQRSIWIRVTLAEGSAGAPPLRVRYESSASLPVVWDSQASNTLVGVKATAPVRLLAIDTDRGLVPPWLVQSWASNW
jgi:hypothetical protein